MSVRYLMLSLAAVAVVGCQSRTNEADVRVAVLALNNLPSIPPEWRKSPQQGTDSRVGYFSSTLHQFRIHYDIGDLAEQYASAKAYPNYKWIKSGSMHGSSFRYLLNDDGTLYVTFSDEGPANFWANVKDAEDIDYVLELLARYRRDLLDS